MRRHGVFLEVNIRRREATPRETRGRQQGKDASMGERAAMDENTRMGSTAYGPMML
jgi:hypothetical protein